MKTPKESILVTVPTKVSPASTSRTMSFMILTAIWAASSLTAATLTLPLSSTSTLAPVCWTMPRIVFPPEPMTSRIFSGSILKVTIFGAVGESSGRGAAIAASIMSSIWKRPFFACERASVSMPRVMPPALLSICSAVTPSRVPATLKSISP
ncbi:hypothetical protein SDC9_199449 [bioreactor metagenome]|uniref:Uncharacterized protein n=1 Tax=bioreactor metagenome TaxID=1076179 RepID=A0A645IL26_9ZZZZ